MKTQPFNMAIILLFNAIDREIKELLPYNIFIITRHLNIRSTCLNHDTYIYFGVPPPPTQYRRAILHDTSTIYTLAGGKPAISLFIHPLSKSLLSTRLLRPLIHPPLLFNSLDLPHAAYCPPLFYKGLRLGP